MSGIILLVVLAIWFVIVTKLTAFFSSKIAPKPPKKWLYPIIFILLFIAPVADEIIGGFQFRAMCTPENLLVYDAEKVKGKTLETNEATTRTINKIIPIRELTREWFDPETNEVLIKHKILHVGGGWLTRLLGLPAYSFNGDCDTREYYEMFDRLNITKIEN